MMNVMRDGSAKPDSRRPLNTGAPADEGSSQRTSGTKARSCRVVPDCRTTLPIAFAVLVAGSSYGSVGMPACESS